MSGSQPLTAAKSSAPEWRIPRRPEHCTPGRYDCRTDADVVTPSPTPAWNEWHRVDDVIGYVTWFAHGREEARLCARLAPSPIDTDVAVWQGELCARCTRMTEAADALCAPTCRMHLRDAVWHACERAQDAECERLFPTREAVEHEIGVIASPAARVALRDRGSLRRQVHVLASFQQFRLYMAQLSAAERESVYALGYMPGFQLSALLARCATVVLTLHDFGAANEAEAVSAARAAGSRTTTALRTKGGTHIGFARHREVPHA